MRPTLVTAAADYPATLAEARAWCRIETTVTDHDARLTLLLAGCTREIEVYLGRALVSQVWEGSTGAFSDEIELAPGPVLSIGHVKYYDADNAQQTASSALYMLDMTRDPQRLALADGQSWPETFDRPDAVTVRFTAGYTPAALLADVKLALLDLIAARFDAADEKTAEAILRRLSGHRRIVI